jgi:hypothetical protein
MATEAAWLNGLYSIQLVLDFGLGSEVFFSNREVSVELTDSCIQWLPVIYGRSGGSP